MGALSTRCLHGALVLAAALGACACRSADQLDRVAVALTPSERLRVLARRTSVLDDGRYLAGHFRFAEQRDGSWRSEVLAVSEGDAGWWGDTPPPRFLIAPDEERTIVVAATIAAGTIVRVRESPDSAWEEVVADPALPSGAVTALHDGAALGGAWLGSDGDLRMLVGEWLLETVDGTITTAIATGDTCTPTRADVGGVRDAGGYIRDVCLFVPTGDRTGTALVFDMIPGTADHPLPIYRTTFQRLSCDLDVCHWTVDPADELGELPFEETIFIQGPDGTPILIRNMPIIARPRDAPATQLLAMTTATTLPIASGIYRFGGAPRPAGGFVVVSSAYYTDALAITVVNTAFEAQRFELPTIVLDGSTRIAVVVAPATSTSSERAHLLLSTSVASIAHLSVDLETGAVEREDFGM